MIDAKSWAAAGFGPDLVPLCAPGCRTCREKGDPGGKAPHVRGWQHVDATAALSGHRGNLGLRTRLFPAIDLDLEDADLADACERVALTTLGSTARRTRQNTARRLLLYRLEGSPFPKATLALTTPRGEKAKVEVLADGQQCVVAGVHHTGAAIEWCGGLPAAADLATMTSELRTVLLLALRARLGELGCAVEDSGGNKASPSRAASALPRPRWGASDSAIAEAALRKLDPDADYERWVKIGMALHSKFPGADGLSMWDAWSSRGSKYRDTRDTEAHWRSFHADGGVGFGTLIALARECGR